MASEAPTAEASQDGHITHVKSNFGFTVYYEISENVSNKLLEVVVIDNKSSERLGFLEECLIKSSFNFEQNNFEKCLLKEAERIFEYEVAYKGLQKGKDMNTDSMCKKTICQYFEKGKCRFGDKCFNHHEKLPLLDGTCNECLANSISSENTAGNIKSKSHKPRNKITENENPGKKPPMKTATDVINRIQWDEKLNPEFFTVGYLDRFVGIIENTFNSFDWNDITSLDPNTLAIPKHRIQYFKFNGKLVWEKNKRLDYVFGSTGSGITIVDVMKNIRNNNETAVETCKQNVEM